MGVCGSKNKKIIKEKSQKDDKDIKYNITNNKVNKIIDNDNLFSAQINPRNFEKEDKSFTKETTKTINEYGNIINNEINNEANVMLGEIDIDFPDVPKNKINEKEYGNIINNEINNEENDVLGELVNCSDVSKNKINEKEYGNIINNEINNEANDVLGELVNCSDVSKNKINEKDNGNIINNETYFKKIESSEKSIKAFSDDPILDEETRKKGNEKDNRHKGEIYCKLNEIIDNAILFPDEFKPEYFKQGYINDCYLISAIEAISKFQQIILKCNMEIQKK